MTTQDKDPLMALLRRTAAGDEAAGVEFDKQRAAHMQARARMEEINRKYSLRMIRRRTTM